MFDLIASFPVLHVLVGILTSIALRFSYEHIWATLMKDPLVNSTTAIVKRFSSTTLAIVTSLAEKMIALYKLVSGALAPVKEAAQTILVVLRFASSILYNTTVMIVNLTITTVQTAVAQGASIGTAVVSWVTHSPSMRPYDLVRVFLPFLLFFLGMSIAYLIRAGIRHEVKKTRYSSRRAMQMAQDLDAATSPSR